MVPSGELHIAAVDYSHTHHPYFCIVKHRFDIHQADAGVSHDDFGELLAWCTMMLLLMMMMIRMVMFRDSGVSQESLPFHLTLRGEATNCTVSPKASSWSWMVKCDWYWSTMIISSVCKSGTSWVRSLEQPSFTIVAKAIHIHLIHIASLSGNPGLGHVLRC